jgi:CheY-like chemotaxis protein
MPKVLLVEDSTTQALRFQLELLRYDLNIEVAGSGSSGLEAARRMAPDVIVLDVELPESGGYALCRSLNADPQTTRIPVVLLTSHQDVGDTLEEMGSGVVDSIPKDSFAAYNLVESLRQLGLL